MIRNKENINKRVFGRGSKNNSIKEKLMYIFSFNENFNVNTFEIENIQFK